MNNQKGFANIVLIVVIVAIVAVGGYFIFSKKSEPITQQTSPTPTQTETSVSPTPTPPSEDGVSVCKIYGSKEFNFEFTCPDGWYVSTNDLSPRLGQAIYFVNDKAILTNKNGNDDFISGIYFGVYDNSKLLTLQQWMDQNIAFGGTSKPIKVAGSEGVRVTGVEYRSGKEVDMVIFPKGDKVFDFSAGEVYISALDKILSTFRFLR